MVVLFIRQDVRSVARKLFFQRLLILRGLRLVSVELAVDLPYELSSELRVIAFGLCSNRSDRIKYATCRPGLSYRTLLATVPEFAFCWPQFGSDPEYAA